MHQLSEDTLPTLEDLARTLWDERHVVELLLYRLTAAKLFLAADERRFVALALDEVEGAMQLLRNAEAGRVRVVAELVARCDARAGDLTLSALAKHAPEPLRSVFADHRRGFRQLAEEIEAAAAANRRLAAAGLDHVCQTIGRLTGGSEHPATYTAQGRQGVAAPAPVRLDRVL